MRVFLICVAFTFVPVSALAAPKPPPAAVMKLADAIVHSANADDASGLAGIFTADATVVDELAPFVWRGAGAGTAWWRTVETELHKTKLTHFRIVNVRISEFVQTPTDAYLIQSETLTGTQDAKPFSEPGTWTYTFHKAGGRWLISTMVWSTKP